MMRDCEEVERHHSFENEKVRHLSVGRSGASRTQIVLKHLTLLEYDVSLH